MMGFSNLVSNELVYVCVVMMWIFLWEIFCVLVGMCWLVWKRCGVVLLLIYVRFRLVLSVVSMLLMGMVWLGVMLKC